MVFRGLYSDRLAKLARRGDRGYPMVTVAFYGPDDSRASKLVVSLLTRSDYVEDLSKLDDEALAKLEESDTPESKLVDQRKWFSETADLRDDGKIARDVLRFIEKHDAKSVVMPGSLIGCPHEEGIDYPEGEACPACPFWKGRDRFKGDPTGKCGRLSATACEPRWSRQ